MNILIVEDNIGDYYLMREMLQQSSLYTHAIDHVKKLSEATERLEENSVDVILLDLMLPDSSGINTFEKVYKLASRIPVIVMSGIMDEDISLQAVRLGAQDYIVKGQLDAPLLNRSIRYAIERKMVEEAYRESEEKFKIIFRESLDVIIIVDINTGKIIKVNETCLQYLGYPESELEGKHYSVLFADESGVSRFEFLEKLRINGAVIESQEFRRKDKSIINMDITATVIPWGRTRAILCTLRDATERKYMEDQLHQANEELEQRVFDRTAQLKRALANLESENMIRRQTEEKLIQVKNEILKAYHKEKDLNELKTRFIQMVSHEYRTPLSVIAASAEFLDMYDKNKSPEKFEKHIFKILRSVESMTKLLEDVLMVGKVESGNLRCNPTEFELADFCDSLVKEVTIADQGRHPVEFKSNVESWLFTSDPLLLRHALSNILTNAMKYSPEHSPVVFSMEISHDQAVFTISDRGMGISEEDLRSIFNPFHRGKNIGNTSGFGLGLQIAHGCIESLEGTISVNSKINEGSTFVVKIPDMKKNSD
ncbi:MAG: ATP-binding protein [Candidatus Kapaibacterium sp.]